MKQLLRVLCLLPLLVACNTAESADSSEDQSSEQVVCYAHPSAQADSLLSYVVKQCDFGPRVPGTASHRACGDYLVSQFQAYGAQVTEQCTTVRGWDGTMLPCRNITASYKPEARYRVLFCAHWDARPWCDEDEDPTQVRKPVMAANDGASGVAVLLELARAFALSAPKVGVDMVLFDVEDYGVSDYENSFCLGSQYWAQQAKAVGYRPAYGVLLDMVGDAHAIFRKDVVSTHYAKDVADKVWDTAAKLGYGSLFATGEGGSIIDDHYYVNQLAGIPCIDIIHYDGGFPTTWHTHRDTPEAIEPQVMRAVTNVLLELVY